MDPIMLNMIVDHIARSSDEQAHVPVAHSRKVRWVLISLGLALLVGLFVFGYTLGA